MTKEEAKAILIERGYPEKAAISVAEKLVCLTGEIKDAAVAWLTSSKEVDFIAGSYSISGLTSRFSGMSYPAALLTIDWLIREPELASKIIEKGIR